MVSKALPWLKALSIAKIKTYFQETPWPSAVLAGLIAGLSMPPLNLWFLLPVAYWLLLKQPRTFLNGWLFKSCFYLVSFYWVAIAPTTIGLWWVIPFALYIPFILGIFHGIAFWQSRNTFDYVVLASSWEFILGLFLPWNLLGYTWSGVDENILGFIFLRTAGLLPLASLIGICGVSFLTLFGACYLFKKLWWVSIASFVAAGVLTVILQEPGTSEFTLRLVQPSIQQKAKHDISKVRNNFEKHMGLSYYSGEKPVDMIIWPEASIPFLVDENVAKIVGDAAFPNGFIIVGAFRKAPDPKTSMIVLNHQGDMLATYDKYKLVPFGEYVPLPKFLGIHKLTSGLLDYTPGEGPKVISVKGLPKFVPLICYEGIFPSMIPGTPRADFILNITNDAWFLNSIGPKQHLAHIRVRAIEEGLPIIRCANNGISAIIDAHGRIIRQLDTDKIGFIDDYLPKALPQTFWSKTKHLQYMMWIIIFFISNIFWLRRRSKK